MVAVSRAIRKEGLWEWGGGGVEAYYMKSMGGEGEEGGGGEGGLAGSGEGSGEGREMGCGGSRGKGR